MTGPATKIMTMWQEVLRSGGARSERKAARGTVARVIGCLLMASVLSLTGCSSKQYALSNYDVILRLKPNGDYVVSEELTFDFQQGEFHYAYRNIPKDQLAAIQNVRVESSDTHIKDVVTKEKADEYRVRWTFPYRREPATFKLTYEVKGALKREGNRRVIDWDAAGTQWTVPVRNAEVQVRIPEKLAIGKNELEVRRPSDATIRAAKEGGWVVEAKQAPVPPGERFRIVVAYRRSTVEP